MSRPIPTMYYVVSTLLARHMRGERVNSKKGTVYAVFNTAEAAYAFMEERKLKLCADVVAQ